MWSNVNLYIFVKFSFSLSGSFCPIDILCSYILSNEPSKTGNMYSDQICSEAPVLIGCVYSLIFRSITVYRNVTNLWSK